MQHPWLDGYIPAGCLDQPVHWEPLSPELLALPAPPQWRFFSRSDTDIPPGSSLPLESQNLLSSQPSIRPFMTLWQKRWIQLSLKTPRRADEPSTVRVYVLPHDIKGANFVNQQDDKLPRSLAKLLETLDFRSATWTEGVAPPSKATPSEQSSLLDMFNQIPSPDPLPNDVASIDTREGMQCLLESNIAGLKSSLYPYQRRSAALMLQRELEPGRIVDPRLKHARDQDGRSWYYDTVAGTVVREPTHYDAPRGGILAEEMGTGKTLICLALILATKDEPTKPPEPYIAETPTRLPRPGLLNLAAAAINKHSVAWKPYFEACQAQYGVSYERCIQALSDPKNRALYRIEMDTVAMPRRSGRTALRVTPQKGVYLSSCTLVVVPNNLVTQWRSEIDKHTTGLKTLALVNKAEIPRTTELLSYDIIIFSASRFEMIEKDRYDPMGREVDCPLEHVRFKRCIIDEGHKLGHKGGWKSDTMRVIERLEISARWAVTGTPSRGLYGVDHASHETDRRTKNRKQLENTIRAEREDIHNIGNLASKYLQVRPWSNSKDEAGDKTADWSTYVMSREQRSTGRDRKDCLKMTLDSLIIRHQIADVSDLLPPVNEKIVLLDGSYQDRLSLNLFSMMIIFNSVQSQRTDVDYFFHAQQRKSLVQLVHNLRQASFFGGVFFSGEEIAKSLATARDFLEKKAVLISPEDEKLLLEAVAFGEVAWSNKLKDVSNRFHAMPIYVKDFPGGKGASWSLDDMEEDGGLVCTDASMIHSLQKFLNPCIDAPASLNLMIDTGRLETQGEAERSQAFTAAQGNGTPATNPRAEALAGQTSLGNDHHSKPKSGILSKAMPAIENDIQPLPGNIEVAEPLAKTQIVSTVSAKLSYLIDAIVQHQENEQIIVFYDNDNIAWYLAGALEVLQIKHLIYARSGLSAQRRAQYVATFTQSPKFRVLLMDISQAAFGLDMRSASRIYFVSPVLNPQVQAQAIGRARRISQQKPVSVETLVLKGSIEEVIINRRQHMTQAEHRRVNSVLDDRPMYDWILNARILPMEQDTQQGLAQTAPLKSPQYVFGRGFGRQIHPDDDLVAGSPPSAHKKRGGSGVTFRGDDAPIPFRSALPAKRPHSPPAPSSSQAAPGEGGASEPPAQKKKKRARIAWAD